MRIVKENTVDVQSIVNTLAQGDIVILPTETVYIAAVDATNPKGIKKLCKYKNRPMGKPFSVAVTNLEMANRYVDLNKTAKLIYTRFLPGPVTVVSKGKHMVAEGTESETGTLGIRIPDYRLILKICNLLDKPITATSANASYKKRPYKITDILDNLSDKQRGLISLVVDAGELPHNEPSTVIDTTLDDAVVLRQGEIKIGNENTVTSRSSENTQNAGKEMWQKFESHFGTRAIIFALEGPMGAGKTQFTKGLAKAMGIKEQVVSPTFNLELEYKIPESNTKILSHIDAWRMQNGEELENLGWKEKINDKSVLVIEWADRVADIIRKYSEEAVVVWIKIDYATTHKDNDPGREDERIIKWGTV